MKEVKVIVDQRERGSGLMDNLKEKGIAVYMKTIPVGDYIISDRVGIERKTVSDFESSLISGRLFDQATRLRENYKLPIIIIEGDRSEFHLGKSIITGAIVALYIDYNTEVILSDDKTDTSNIIASIAKHEQAQNDIGPSLKGGKRAYTDSHFQEYMVGNLPGIGPKLAKSLLKHFKSVKNIANASVEELMKVEKIGKKKAKRIHETINNDYKEELLKS